MFRTQLETSSTPRVESRIHEAPRQYSMLATTWAALRRALRFVGWMLGGFGLAHSLRSRFLSGTVARVAGGGDEIVVYCVHRSFYLWAMILAGFIGAACVRHWPASAGAWGWVYVMVLLYTLLTLLFDVSSLKALL